MRKLIVRADDLGYSQGVNHGIAKSVNEGIIRNVGVMPNMPDVEHGIELLKHSDVCFGLHTNICVGKPLTDPKKIPSIVDENGDFLSSKTYRESEVDFVVLDEVILEIEAQYLRFIELFSKKPGYFEGHAVRSEIFNEGLRIVAEKYGCDNLENPVNRMPKFKNTILHVVSEFFLEDYDPFETLKKAALAEYDDGGISMVIYHPGYLDKFIMQTSSLLEPRVLEVEALCSDETKKWLKDNNIELITYEEVF